MNIHAIRFELEEAITEIKKIDTFSVRNGYSDNVDIVKKYLKLSTKRDRLVLEISMIEVIDEIMEL